MTGLKTSGENLPVLEICRRLADELRRSGVRFLHWKSNNHLDEALAGLTDLDILVDGEGSGTFREVVTKLGGMEVISPAWGRYPEVEDWLLMDSASGRMVHLHAHFILVTGLKRVKHLYLPWAGRMLESRRESKGGWMVPAPEFELLVLLIRIWAKMPTWRRLVSPTVPRSIMEELSWLQGQVKAEDLHELARELGVEFNAGLPLRDEREAISQARALYAQTRRHYRMSWPRALWSWAELGLRKWLAKTRLKIAGPVRYRKTIRNGGLMVAVVGVDGSGKSTVTNELTSWLRYKIDAHCLYMGSGDGRAGLVNGLRKRISRAIRKMRRKKKSGKGAAAAGSKPAGPAPFGKKLYRLLDLLLVRRKLKYLRRARRMADEGSVMILDRYPQPQFTGINDGPRQKDGRGFDWAWKMEERLLREAEALGPDLVLRLDIDPEVALARKRDHDKDAVRRKAEILPQLTFGTAKIVPIDASMPLDEVLLAAKSTIWNELTGGGGE